jgi:putative transposase
MPRGARLDYPGTLHHVMVRGMEGNCIVSDDDDRKFFVTRMGVVAAATGTTVYAWSLMSNHAHILLKSGPEGISSFMSKLLTGYAIRYNNRHKRHGHLFQNRYKSIVCEEEPYFLKLVSYIHLNPLRAGLVGTLAELQLYPWSGHAAVMGRIRYEWQDRDYVLGYFGNRESTARKSYADFVATESGLGRQPELTGGGLVRSAGGWSEVKSLRKRQQKQFNDERILGSGEFVRGILDDVEESAKEKLPAASTEIEGEKRLKQACEESGIALNAIQSGSRVQECSALRKRLALDFVHELGMSYAGVARLLGVSPGAVHQIIKRNGLKI